MELKVVRVLGKSLVGSGKKQIRGYFRLYYRGWRAMGDEAQLVWDHAS